MGTLAIRHLLQLLFDSQVENLARPPPVLGSPWIGHQTLCSSYRLGIFKGNSGKFYGIALAAYLYQRSCHLHYPNTLDDSLLDSRKRSLQSMKETVLSQYKLCLTFKSLHKDQN